ncbi:MAG: [protein-PII] uridylyltransferase [Gammaproteobacteria bacterium]|nr:[protein-PII] uridylyltransferase [Gammaproteobacteria bacterium]
MQLFFSGSFDRALASTTTPLELFRHTLQSVDQALAERFAKGVPVTDLVRQRVWFVDELLLRAWHRFIPPQGGGIALVAVGGYGRHELHPNSDIDLLILLEPDAQAARQGSLEKFLAFLWDIGLEVGHSVRTVQQCVEEAGQDVGVATNLMEARLLAGDDALFQTMCARTGPEHVWPTRAFFEAKWREQLARHRKYHDTAYNLEPNVKEGPGGLRDIQTIAWVAKRHFRTGTLRDLVARDFLTQREYADLAQGREFLWKVRYALHLLTGRNENRLLFDYQRTLAAQFGYQDDHRLAVENFMKDYYRAITELSRLNEMLLQLFQEVILHADAPVEIVRINKRFQSCNGFIEVADTGVFRRYPFALLEIFLLLEQDRTLKGVRAATIRLIRDHRHLVDDRFRNDLRCRSLFMEILRQPSGVTHELRRMNRYGILAAYFPAFGTIVGQMQYDLFHVYTVDDHTLHVLRNLRRFTVPAYEQEFPLCSRIMKRIPKPELLYLGALFHDIAKGRGGDHSELGAADAFAFCRHHGLSDYDAHLVSWLVRNHLIMSSTAQHKDISDPDVIAEFARKVGDTARLEYLYLLTVADIRGTNPTLWNGWKDALLIDLYSSTRSILGRGLDSPVDKDERIAETRTAALALLAVADAERIITVWSELDEEYFLRHSPDEIAWQMRLILAGRPEDLPLIRVREETGRGGTEIFIYARDQDHLFAMTTSALDQLGLNVLNARVITTRSGYTLDTYIVLDENGGTIRDPHRIREIADTIRTRISRGDIRAARTSRRPARQLRHFSIPTQVVFSEDAHHRYTIAELTTVDRPGLLARVGQAFVECGVRLQNAKIATFGERVEDVFFVTDKSNRPLNGQAQLDALRDSLIRHLDEK